MRCRHPLGNSKYEISIAQYGNVSFLFCVDSFSLPPTRALPKLTIWLTRRLSYRKQKLFTLRKHQDSVPVFFGWYVLLIFFGGVGSMLCVFVLFFLIVRCCWCLWVVNSWLPLQFSLTFILIVDMVWDDFIINENFSSLIM